jgi:hypothetical protein
MSKINIGGVYTDPFHSPTTVSANIYGLKAPWFGGIRIFGSTKEKPEQIQCIGCDDGVHFWTLRVEMQTGITGIMTIDFTPKAPGVGLLKCKYRAGDISFLEEDGATVGNTWSRLIPTDEFDLDVEQKHSAFNDVNGLHVDESIYKHGGGFAGIRVVSDRLGKIITDEICVIGTDDGTHWWAMEGGAFRNRLTGEFTIGSLNGVCQSGTITFQDGKKWTKMAVKSDVHAMPKEILGERR